MKNKTIKLNRFTDGMNNVESETDLTENSLREAINVDITKEGRIKRRDGYVKIYTGTNIHSLYNGYFVEEGTIKRLLKDYTAQDIVSGVGGKHLSYCILNGEIYFSNEDVNGKMNGPWGVEDVLRSPIVSVGSGTLKAGNYQVSVCHISETGEKGGATNPILVNVPDNSSIVIENISQSESGYNTVIYMSTPDGSELYEYGVVNYGVTSYEIATLKIDGDKIETLFMKQVIPGHIIRHYKGRIYIAEGSTLWFTEAQRYGLYSPGSTFFNFPERITVLQETETGLFIVADKTYFLTGTEPKNMQLSIISNETGIEGTGISVDAKDFKLEVTGKIAYWYSSKGAILGYDNGQLKYLSEDKFDLAMTARNGVSNYVEHEGMQKIITNLFEQNSNGSAFGASDNVIAQVVRNGVVI